MAIATILTTNGSTGRFVTTDNFLYFVDGGFDSSQSSSIFLNRTDGTETGTIPLMNSSGENRDFFLASGNLPDNSATIGDNLLFSGSTEFSTEPSTGSIVYTNQELYISDGTLEGTKILKEINPTEPTSAAKNVGSNPEDFVSLNELVVFTAFDGGSNGRTIWSTDGTAAGTKQIADVIESESSDFLREFDVSDRPVNGNILLEGFDGETTGLWKTDGSSTGTQLIRSFEPVVSGEEVDLDFVSVAGNNLFFQIDNSLWRSDGTDEGTQLIVPEIPLIREEFEEPIALGVGNNLFFNSFSNLWTSDGTAEGTQIIKESRDFEGFLEDFVGANGKLFFIDRDDVKNRDLWQSDGTAEGTQLIFDGNVTDVVESANGNVYFLNQTDDNLDELWRTDGTEAGTVLIEPSDSFDVIDASNDAFRAFDTLNDRIFFTGSTIIEGQNTNALFAVEDTKLSSQAGAEGVISDETDEFIENAVYRFFNNNSGVHFYTASEVERDAVFELTNFNYEGASYLGVDSLSGQPEPVPVYRFLNQDTGVHLYTISETEKDAVQKLNNFSFEGEAFLAYESEVEGSIPIYRFFNSTSGAHFYTPSAGERDNVEDNLPEFQSEGIAYYALPLPE